MCSDFTITLYFPFPLENLKASEGRVVGCLYDHSGFQCCAEEAQSNQGGSESHWEVRALPLV